MTRAPGILLVLLLSASAGPARADDTRGPTPRGRGLRIAGLATAGAGVVALVSGVVFGIRAAEASRDAEALYAVGARWDPDVEARGERYQTLTIVSFSAGVLAAATGVTLYVLGDRAASVQPTLAPGTAGASIEIRF